MSYTNIPPVVSFLPVCCQQFYKHFPLLLFELRNRIANHPVATGLMTRGKTQAPFWDSGLTAKCPSPPQSAKWLLNSATRAKNPNFLPSRVSLLLIFQRSATFRILKASRLIIVLQKRRKNITDCTNLFRAFLNFSKRLFFPAHMKM